MPHLPAPFKPATVLISVITVSWNAAASIDATCASVDAQTHPEVEHLVIDGQSTDARWRCSRAGPVEASALSEADRGLDDAMNKGLARARGEVVVFLNADDRYSGPGVLTAVSLRYLGCACTATSTW